MMKILLYGKLYDVDSDTNLYSEAQVDDIYSKEYIKLYLENCDRNINMYSESSKLLKNMGKLLSNVKTRTSDKLRAVGSSIKDMVSYKPKVSYNSYRIDGSEDNRSLGTILSKEFNEKEIRKDDILQYAKNSYDEVKARLNLSKSFASFVSANRNKYKGKMSADDRWNITIDEVSKSMSLFQDYTYSESFFVDNKELSAVVFEVINGRLKDDLSFTKTKYSEFLPTHPLKGIQGGAEVLSNVENKLRKAIPTLPKVNTLVTYVTDVLEHYTNILAAAWFITLSGHVWLSTKNWYYEYIKNKSKVDSAVTGKFIGEQDIQKIVKEFDPGDKLKEIIGMLDPRLKMRNSIVSLTNAAVRVLSSGEDYGFDKFISQVLKECDKMLTLKYKPNNLSDYKDIEAATNTISYVNIDNKENKLEIIKTQDKFFIIGNEDTYKNTLKIQYELIDKLRKSKVDLDISTSNIILFSSKLTDVGGYIYQNIKSFESANENNSEAKIMKDLIDVAFSLYVNLWSCLDIMIFLLNNIGHPMYRKIKLDIASLVLGSYVCMLEDLN